MERTDYFEAFVNRTMPVHLRDDAPIPPTWSGDTDTWTELVRSGRAYHRAAAALRFTEMIANGWRPEEAAAGGFDPRSGRGLSMTGQVVTGQSKMSAESWRELEEWDAQRRALIKSRQSNEPKPTA